MSRNVKKIGKHLQSFFPRAGEIYVAKNEANWGPDICKYGKTTKEVQVRMKHYHSHQPDKPTLIKTFFCFNVSLVEANIEEQVSHFDPVPGHREMLRRPWPDVLAIIENMLMKDEEFSNLLGFDVYALQTTRRNQRHKIDQDDIKVDAEAQAQGQAQAYDDLALDPLLLDDALIIKQNKKGFLSAGKLRNFSYFKKTTKTRMPKQKGKRTAVERRNALHIRERDHGSRRSSTE